MEKCENMNEIYLKKKCIKNYMKTIPKTLSGIRKNRQKNYKNALDRIAMYKSEENFTPKIVSMQINRSRSPAPLSRPVSTRSRSPAPVSAAPVSRSNAKNALNALNRILGNKNPRGGKYKSRKRRKNTKRRKSRKRF